MRPAAPLWLVALALALGALGALLAPAPHVHQSDGGSWAHQHFFAGPHSHAAGAHLPPLLPAGGDAAGDSGEAPEGERGSSVVALGLALSLDLALPRLPPASASPFPLPRPARPALPRGAEPAFAGGPRGPPAFSC